MSRKDQTSDNVHPPGSPRGMGRTLDVRHKSSNSTSGNQTGASITPKEREIYLSTLKATGLHTKSALAAGRAPNTFRALIDLDPVFQEQAETCIEDFRDSLEKEAYRRAHDGVERPVFQGGQLVGHTRDYSDRLMELLLKGNRRHKFGDSVKVDATVTAPVRMKVG